MKWIITKKFKEQTIREYLRNEQLFSRRLLKSVVNDDGLIVLNGRSVRLNHHLVEGDELIVKLPEETKGLNMEPEEIYLDIIYEDDFLMVINKPAKMATIPSYHHPDGTLANGILAYYEKKRIPYTVHIVTRLDRDTSGLVLIAKNSYSHSLLSNSQKKQTIYRSYYAIVTGELMPIEGVIDKNIGRKEGSIIERQVVSSGQTAITYYKTMKVIEDYSLLAVQLKTGRTHQIRVHLAHMGHPLVGDDLYGKATEDITRQALHCHELRFQHPFTKKWITCHAALPEDMKKIISFK